MLRYSYYTAGSGGAGPTILETSFLLAGEQCTVYKEGQAYKLPPISNRREVDFGPGEQLLEKLHREGQGKGLLHIAPAAAASAAPNIDC
jgi:hypothetical protein